MGFTTRAAVAGLLLGAAKASPVYGNGTIAYTTEVVTALTTYCPAATTLTYNDKTYTITEATTLTITDCPCTISKPAKPTATGPPKDACAEHCYEAYNECRVAKGANMATCAAKYAECLGYSPFGNDGSLVTPTACSKKPAPTKPVYTTEVVTAITTYCPEPTTLSYNNKTYTITKPTTFTITDCPCTISKPHGPAPPKPSAPAHDCAKECTDAYNMCRSGPGANMATCAAKYAECLGYSPFGDDGSLKTPTACSATGPAPTGPAPTGPAPTGPAPTGPAPTGPAPTSPAPVVPVHDCAKECTEAYNKCRSGSGANMATCAAEYAKCLGYSPFGDDGSLVTPTACSATGPAPTGPVATPTGGNPPVVTAGAGRIAPAGMIVALGAIALF
ncbi:hypothetical protein NW754_007425 [Fusarium falciforme]|nr:hypothetical protein NW754_007425 [Fusarium falciforme]